MKFVRHFRLILCLILLIGCLSGPSYATQTAADMSALSGCRGFDATAPLLGAGQPIENVEAAILYEVQTDTMMFAQNPDAQLYPASLVKIMTGLIALEEGNLADIVTISGQVLSAVPSDATTADLLADEVVTLEQLMYCMMVESANDAAMVIAAHIAGDQNAFVAKMNRYAQELGCTGTNFTNATGLHNDQQVTTARDMARILSAAMKNPEFATFFGTTHYTVEATNKSEARNLSTGNHMMHMDIFEIYYDERVTGGRTGVTTSGERCIAVSAEQNGMQLISVMLGAKDQYADDGYTVKRIGGFEETTALLDQGFTGYKTAQLLYDGQAVKQASVLNGSADVVLGSRVSVSSVLPQDATVSSLSYRYSDLANAFSAPIEKGQHLSDLEIWCGNICVAQAQLYAMNAVSSLTEQANQDIVKEKSSVWPAALTVVLVILAILAGFVLLLRLVRRLRILSARSRSKRHRRNRRRSR